MKYSVRVFTLCLSAKGCVPLNEKSQESFLKSPFYLFWSVHAVVWNIDHFNVQCASSNQNVESIKFIIMN